MIPPYLATTAVFTSCNVVRNDRLGRDTYRLRIEAPEIAARIQPGQFVMIRLPDCDDPLIGRPMALFDTFLGVDGAILGLDLVYLVAGKLTTRLKELDCGARVQVWGPLGNGFRRNPCRQLVMVAGGIGHTPFLAVAQSALGIKAYCGEPCCRWAEEVTYCYGVRTAEFFAGLELFEGIGVKLKLATDDGSRGHHGLVTELVATELRPQDVRVVCCGPEPMMAAVASICHDAQISCEVSMETPMACGFGACFSCVAPLRDEAEFSDWDYKRTCVEGPVFNSRRIVWGA